MRAYIFLNFIFLVIRDKDELYVLSLESVTSIKKPINPLKVVYHPVSCLLHHYTHSSHLTSFYITELSVSKKFELINKIM